MTPRGKNTDPPADAPDADKKDAPPVDESPRWNLTAEAVPTLTPSESKLSKVPEEVKALFERSHSEKTALRVETGGDESFAKELIRHLRAYAEHGEPRRTVRIKQEDGATAVRFKATDFQAAKPATETAESSPETSSDANS